MFSSLHLNFDNFREKADIEAATLDSVRDEVYNDDADLDDEEYDAGGSLTCGVEECSGSETVWPNRNRLDRHR